MSLGCLSNTTSYHTYSFSNAHMMTVLFFRQHLTQPSKKSMGEHTYICLCMLHIAHGLTERSMSKRLSKKFPRPYVLRVALSTTSYAEFFICAILARPATPGGREVTSAMLTLKERPAKRCLSIYIYICVYKYIYVCVCV